MEHWLHVGHQNWSPHRPTFLRVQPVPDPGEVAPDHNRTYVASLNSCCDIHKVASAFVKCDSVVMRCYTLESSERPIARLTPACVPVLSETRLGALQVWPPPPRTRRASAKSAPKVGEPTADDDGAQKTAQLDDEVEKIATALLESYEFGVSMAMAAPPEPATPVATATATPTTKSTGRYEVGARVALGIRPRRRQWFHGRRQRGVCARRRCVWCTRPTDESPCTAAVGSRQSARSTVIVVSHGAATGRLGRLRRNQACPWA